MHPKYVQKCKALVWYWLNNHPAETTFVSPTEMGASEFGELGEDMTKDMLIQAVNHWNIADILVGDAKARMSYCQSDLGGYCRLIRLDRIPACITRD